MSNPVPPKISLVLNYYNPKAIPRIDTITLLCLQTLKDFAKVPMEVILSNGSGVDSPFMISACEQLQFRYSLSPVPQNFEAIYNHGLSLATGEYVGILENDIFMSEGWETTMLSEMQRTGANLAVPYLSSCDNIIQQSGFLVKHGTFEPSCISHNMMLFDRTAFKVVYPFDTQFNATHNDNDLYLRMKKAGLRMIVAKGAYAIHYRRATAGYNPWSFNEDFEKFRKKYPELRFDSAYTHFRIDSPTFCRSRTYMNLLKVAEGFPIKKYRPTLARHVRRLEPLFHKI
jgi:GT2 family glycosyltransferase